ncbi:Hypothetical predicted protein, partial [Scomber scombrus]
RQRHVSRLHNKPKLTVFLPSYRGRYRAELTGPPGADTVADTRTRNSHAGVGGNIGAPTSQEESDDRAIYVMFQSRFRCDSC